MIAKLSILLCIGTIMLCKTQAQPATTSHATLRIGCTDIHEGQHTLYLRQIKGKNPIAQEINLNIHSMNDPLPYKGGSKLSFYRTRKEAEDTENIAEPSASCILPADGSFFILLVPHLSNADESKTDYNILVIPSSDVAFGSLLLMNYSKYPLHVVIDKTKREIRPGKREVFKFPRGLKNGRTNMFIEPTQGILQSIRSSRWSLAADTREFVILYNSPQSEGVLFKHILDKEEPR